MGVKVADIVPVMVGAGEVVHAGVLLKVKTYWGEKHAPLCGKKGNTGGIIRAGCFPVRDREVTCKRCLVTLANMRAAEEKRAKDGD